MAQDDRELGVVEVYDRLTPMLESYPLKRLDRTPADSAEKDDMPCIFVIEGEDPIIKYSSRSNLGYPCYRKLQLIVEVWELASSGDNAVVKLLTNEARKAILANEGVLLKGVVIRESKVIGPFNLGVPNTVGMRLFFDLPYKDEGPFV